MMTRESNQLCGESGLLFVLVSGIGTTSSLFSSLRPFLDRRGRVLEPKPLSGDTLSEQAAELLRVLPGPAIVIAHSFGGYLALEALKSGAPSIEAAVLINTSARPESAMTGKFRSEQIERVRSGALADAAARRFSALVHPSRQGDADLRQRFVDMAAEQGAEDFIRLSRAAMKRADTRPDLGGITQPLLVIAGDADRLTRPAWSAEIASGAPNAELHVLSDCGHLAPLEAPAELTTLVADWLDHGLGGSARVDPHDGAGD